MRIEDLKYVRYWYSALIVAGGAIAVVSVPLGAKPMFLMGLGMLLAGVGESANRRRVENLNTALMPQAIITCHAIIRIPTPIGGILDAAGIALFLGGLAWFLIL